jgi:TPR repeat protein
MRFLILLALTAVLSACTSPGTKPGPAAEAGGSKSSRVGIPELANKSVAELEQLAAAGDARAHVELASRYGVGEGVKQDFGKAAALLKAAADRDDPDGETHLGTLYYFGTGVPQDKAMAVSFFERAAKHHHPLGDFWLGYMIFHGEGGISASAAGAVPYFWDAAIQGFPEAQFYLGFVYDHGTDIDRNAKAAAYWYRRASSKEPHFKAMINLRALINNHEIEWQPGDPGEAPAPLNSPSS